MYTSIRFPLLVAVVWSSIGFVAAADDAAVLKEIYQDWSARRQKNKRIKYVAKGSTVIFKGAYNGHRTDFPKEMTTDFPPEDHHFKTEYTLLLDFEHNRVRKEVLGDIVIFPESRFRSVFEVALFDGKEFQRYRPRNRNTTADYTPPPHAVELYLERPEYRGVFTAPDQPFFYAHGCRPNLAAPSGKLQGPFEDEPLHVHGRVVHQGRNHVVLQTGPRQNDLGSYDEYLVDTNRDSAVTRYTIFGNWRARRRVDIEYQHTSHGWLPSEMKTVTQGTLSTETIQTLKIDDIAVNPDFSADMFHVTPTEGMVVKDRVADRLFVAGPPGSKGTEAADAFPEVFGR